MSDPEARSKKNGSAGGTETPHSGHRARLRQRLADGGPDALLDHEILEYLLALAIPRRDTKPLAKTLIGRFGTLGDVLTADWSALNRVDGMGDTSIAAVKIVQAATLRMLKQQVQDRPVLSSWQSLLDYLQADMAYLDVERVRVLHMNNRNMLIRDDHMGDGSIDSAAIYVREIIKRAMELSSASLIVVHNHPSGAPDPSKQDIAITRDLVNAARPLGINVLDHIIIGRGAHKSLRSLGLL
ncbi:DNA repair protein RadC [Sphingobium sufflavum]|uniref:RadC family protein n=1 Tax=Sphingobium sufflavum TaxID=1129547 RepID=UPI001F273B23|nr:DNA repair protein RadC [Sphingobium sufflavum]MCE7797022.1 DNA repair protein RadC [Sphingobium sufflavum]